MKEIEPRSLAEPPLRRISWFPLTTGMPSRPSARSRCAPALRITRTPPRLASSPPAAVGRAASDSDADHVWGLRAAKASLAPPAECRDLPRQDCTLWRVLLLLHKAPMVIKSGPSPSRWRGRRLRPLGDEEQGCPHGHGHRDHTMVPVGDI